MEVNTVKRPEYDGVKFYSVHDWGLGEHLAKAAIILESFDENEKYIHTYREIEHNNLLVELHIGINNHTKIYLVNPFEEQEKSKIYWYPIYFGPSVMEFDPSALKIYRKEMGVTQEDVANAVGVQLRTYQNWEAGNGSKPDGYSLIRIMNYLDIESVQFIIKNEVIQDDGFAKFKSGRPLSSFLNKDENAKERRN